MARGTRLIEYWLIGALAALLSLPATAFAERSVPRGFVGVVAEGPLLDPSTDFGGELDNMVAAGVETMRVSFPWIHAQPVASFDDLPVTERTRYADVGGVPTDWTFTDGVVRAAAQRQLRVLPVVIEAPGWAARHPGIFGSPPSPQTAYARFVGALAARYGSNGSFWAENPDLPRQPIRDWQIWNEPNIPDFWIDQPSYRDYVKLLRNVRGELDRADPSARIVSAGVVNDSWRFLRQFYAYGGGRYVDVVAIHPFTKTVAGVLTIVKRNREVMREYGDARKPIILSEISWTSAKGRLSGYLGIEVNEAQQASRLRAAYSQLAALRRQLRLEGIYWFSWLTQDRGDWSFWYAGLRTFGPDGIRPKPAFAAFRHTALSLEGCAAKAGVATSCER